MDMVQKKAKENTFLPDEIIANILIRLPVKSVMSCSLVCNGWNDIILSQDFADLHLRSSSIPSVIIVTFLKHRSLVNLFALDKWWEPAKTRFTNQSLPFHYDVYDNTSCALFSQAGLIVLEGFLELGTKFVILNPIRPSFENVTINLSEEFRGSNMCALYYHPYLKDYCCLLKIQHKSSSFDYKLLNLGFNPSLKSISISTDYETKYDNSKPLFVENYLYWMLKSDLDHRYGGCNNVLAFDIINEESKVIPCPIPLNTECRSFQTHLVNNNGILSFVLFLPTKITIWRLKDHTEHLWMIPTEYNIDLEIFNSVGWVKIIDVVNGQLAFQWNGDLFICNLMEGTMKNYPRKKCDGYRSFFSHQMSLESLKNCKSELFINNDYKILV